MGKRVKKHIHFFIANTHNFCGDFMDMLASPENGFHAEEHEIWIFSSKGYKELPDSVPKKLVEGAIGIQYVRNINRALGECKWLWLHSMPAPHYSLMIKRCGWKRIIWRTWGHDIKGYRLKTKGGLLSNFVKKVIMFFWKREISKFRAIGLENVVDRVAIQETFQQIPPIYGIYYKPRGGYEKVIQTKESKEWGVDGACNVMIGHSGSPDEGHLEVLQRFHRYQNENFRFFMVLSYGNEDYIRGLKKQIHQRKNVTIIDRYLGHDEYLAFLKSMDIAVLNATRSYALSNLEMLLCLGKKIYLNEDGAIRKGFLYDGIPHGVVSDIGRLDASMIKKGFVYTDGMKKSTLFYQPYENYVGGLRNCLSCLEQEEKNIESDRKKG